MIHGQALESRTSGPTAGEAQAHTHMGLEGEIRGPAGYAAGWKGCYSSASLRLRLHETPQPV